MSKRYQKPRTGDVYFAKHNGMPTALRGLIEPNGATKPNNLRCRHGVPWQETCIECLAVDDVDHDGGQRP